MKAALTPIEQWQALIYAARAAAMSPHSPTATEILAKRAGAVARLEASGPHHQLRGLAFGWARMDDRHRLSNGPALLAAADKVRAVMEGRPEGSPDPAATAATAPKLSAAEPLHIRKPYADDEDREDAA